MSADNGLRWWIDEPQVAAVASPGICIRGWCFEESGKPIRGIQARVGRKAVAGRYGWSRPDVRTAVNGPPNSAESGFSVSVRLWPGANCVRLEADVEGQGWVEFKALDLQSSWSDAIPHALRLARFRLQSVLGMRRALDRLTSAERDFVFTRIDQNGGHPLQQLPHHPPREVTLERFPTSTIPPEKLPKITVVTPSFQQGRYLEATMRSVLDQQGVRLDYIVQDGGSTDRTVDLLRRYAPRLKHWASEPDDGQAAAILRGCDKMEAGPDDIMAYLNSDDLLMPGAARFVAEYFARHPEADLIYGHRVLIDEAGKEVGRWLAPRRSCDNLRMQDLVPQETLFWRKRIWDRVGGIDRSFHFALDWDLLIRFSDAGARFVRLPWFLGLFRLHAHQKSQALLQEVGIPEMDRLRERSLGRTPTRAELVASMQRAQVDSTLLRGWFERGWRV